MGICMWSSTWYYLWNYRLIRVEVSILFESFPPNSLMIHHSHRVDGGILYHQWQPRRAMISCILFQDSGYNISCKSIHPIEGLLIFPIILWVTFWLLCDGLCILIRVRVHFHDADNSRSLWTCSFLSMIEWVRDIFCLIRLGTISRQRIMVVIILNIDIGARINVSISAFCGSSEHEWNPVTSSTVEHGKCTWFP